jgi:hypothetical protein
MRSIDKMLHRAFLAKCAARALEHWTMEEAVGTLTSLQTGLGLGGGSFRRANGERVRKMKTNDCFGGNVNLLTACKSLDSGASATSCGSTDGSPFAAAEDSAEDSTDGSAATNFFSGVGATAFAGDGVGVGG